MTGQVDPKSLGGGIYDSPFTNNVTDAEEPQRRRADLARMIEGEIIPRLMFAHGRESPHAERLARVPPYRIVVADVARFSHLILHDDDQALSNYIDDLLERGTPLDQLFLCLLAPVARQLGEMWNADTCSFTEVTIGLLRLQQLLRRYTPGFYRHQLNVGDDRSVLLTALPGEQHTFGLLMLAEFFRRAGWAVDQEPAGSMASLVSCVGAHWFTAVGLSLSVERRTNEIAELIMTLRSHSQNPNMGVMVGGSVFSERPELVDFVGADIGGRDAAGTVVDAEDFRSLVHSRSG